LTSPIPYPGEIIALATAAMWATCSLLFAAAGRRVGAFAVNQIRVAMAVCLLVPTHLIVFGTFFPTGLSGSHLLLLALSGAIGLALGDFFYFGCLVMLGAQMGMLVMSTWPIFAALLAWIFLGDSLNWAAWCGIAITLAGVGWVVLERKPNADNSHSHKHVLLGTLVGMIGALGQAAGYVMMRPLMKLQDGRPGVNALSGTLVRMTTAMIIVWLVALCAGQMKKTLSAAKDRRALAMTSGGAFTGPFIGVWLSLAALHFISPGVSGALMATAPVLIIPMVVVVHKERPSPRAILGAIVAVCGVSVIFLRDEIARILASWVG